MIDKQTLDALFDMSYGIYIVSSSDGGRLNGQITNTVFQVTAEPPRMAVAVNKQNLTHEYISKSGSYTVSTLVEGTPMIFIGLFGFKSGRNVNKFEKTKYKLAESGAPFVLDNTISAFDVKVTQTVDVGTHTLFVGDVLKGEILADGKPLTYAYYYNVMRGKTPRGATTFKPFQPGGETSPVKEMKP